MLVETDPVPHLVLDVRAPDERVRAPLPPEMAVASVATAGLQIPDILRDEGVWGLHFQRPFPTRDHLLVVVGSTEAQQRLAAAELCDLGYQKIGVLEAGVGAFSQGEKQASLTFISRDALALLLGHRSAGPRPPLLSDCMVIDLRRPDERALYGHIAGTVPLPVEQLGSALQGSEAAFQEEYRCEKPPQGQVLVMQCRTNRRATWAAQLAVDCGYERVLVYRQGTYWWRLDPMVKPYGSYEVWDPPPDPEEFTPEVVDQRLAREELVQLGITPPETGGLAQAQSVPQRMSG